MTNKLSNIEKDTLSMLEYDSRLTFSYIGKKLGKSQQQISYTVNSLSEKNIIKNFFALIDYSKLSVINFRVFIKINYFSEKKFDELIDFLIDNHFTSWIERCGGSYDLICTFLASNASQFNKELRSIIERFPKIIQDFIILTTIVIRSFGRKYLFKNFLSSSQIIFGGDTLPEKIDRIDLKILDSLSQDARKSSVKISQQIGLTPKAAIQRIKGLIKKKMILGFKPIINVRNIGYISNLLLIRYHNISIEQEQELVKYLKAHPNIVIIIKTLGEWDIEVKIETRDSIEFGKVEMEIRQKFAQLIQEIESMPLYRTYKNNYFPKFLID